MKKLLLILILILQIPAAKAQNCTVNAGVDGTFCLYDSIRLNGFKAGLLSGGTRWSQLSGPSAIISNPFALNSSIRGVVPGVYVFNLRSRCADGSNANDQITITVLNTSRANAGLDRVMCPGTGNLNGNAPGTGETGSWSFVQNNGNFVINNSASPTSSFSTLNSNGGTSILRWTISNTNGCSSSDDVTFVNYGGVTPVRTQDSITLSPCYSVFTSTGLYGSFAGKGVGGQSATWNVLSGPNTPNLTNRNSDSAFASGLIQGVYFFEYVVSGPCASGRDTLKVTVPPPLGALSPSGGFALFLCDRPTSYVLNGAPPIYINDSCRWSQISGPTSVSFNPTNTASTTVSGLSGKARDVYQFSYLMSNPVTGCIQNNLITLTYVDTPSISAFSDRILPCNQDTAIIRYNDTGGRTTTVTQMSGPSSTIANGSFIDTISKFIRLSDLNQSGLYTYRIRRSAGVGQACTNVETFINVIVSRQPGIANAGSSQRLNCNIDTTELAGNIPTEGSGNWYQNYGPSVSQIDDTTNNITAVRNLIAGRYQYRWIINGGQACNPTQDDVTVFVADSVPVAAAGGADQTICFLSRLYLSGNQPGSNSFGVWHVLPDSGVVFSDSTAYNATVTGLDSNRTYRFVWKVYNSCGYSTDTVDVTVNSNVAALPANAGNDRCLPDTTSIFYLQGNAPWPGSGQWSKVFGPTDSIANDTVYNSAVYPSGPGHYAYEWRIGNGICASGFDTVFISIGDTVTPAFAGANKDTCSNHLVLRGNQPVNGTGHWSLQIGRINGNMLFPDSFRTEVLNLSQGTYIYRWTIRNGACGSSFDDVKINIANPTTVPLTQKGQVWCNPATITINANRITKGIGYWSLQGINPNSPSFFSKDSAQTTVSGMIAGIYAFKWNSVNPMGICPNLSDVRYDTIIYPANAGSDQRICKRYNVLLSGGIGSSGYWKKHSGGTVTLDTTGSNSAIASNMNSAGSPYQFVFEVNPDYGCSNNSDTVTIEVFDSTKTPFAGIDQTLCDKDTFYLNGNIVSPDSGLWTQVSGPNTSSFTNATLYNTKVYNTQGGSYLYQWTSKNLGCVKSDFVLIRNYDSSATADAGPDTTICPPYSIMKAISSGNHSAIWQQVSGPNNANIQSGIDPQTRINNLIKGTYVFEWIVNNGICPPSHDSVSISVPYDAPDNALAGADLNICGLDSLNLSANAPGIGTGVWRQIAGQVVNIVDDTLSTTALTFIDTGRSAFEWKITNGNCISIDTVEINKTPSPSQANAKNDTGYCLYVPVSISATVPAIGRGLWREISNGGAFIITPDSFYTDVSGLGAGSYQFEWSVSNGTCDPSLDTVTITIDSIPSLSDAGPDIRTCLGSVVMAALPPAAGTGTWNLLNGISTPSVSDIHSDTATVSNLDSGIYRYEWEVGKGGCVNRDTMNIVLTDPQANDQCLQPIVITDPGGTFYGDLCGAKTYGSEPNTYGYNACNTIFYRFHTIGYNYVKKLTLDFTTMNNCPFGLRVSLFDSAACPGLGVQHDTTVIVNSPGYIEFDSLKANQGYILVIDENRNPCAKTLCNLTFRAQGNALPVYLLNFNVRSLGKYKANIEWELSNDDNVVSYELWKIEDGQKIRLQSYKRQEERISRFSYNDNSIHTYPVEYIVYSKLSSGALKELGSRVLYQSDIADEFIIYPNPSTGSFRIQSDMLEMHQHADIIIYNHLGEMVFLKNEIDLSLQPEIQVGDLASGLYFARIYSRNQWQTIAFEINK
ncbi:MAG: T9SS type A sorting domain-containing protein [Chitinophagaceae bacterium]